MIAFLVTALIVALLLLVGCCRALYRMTEHLDWWVAHALAGTERFVRYYEPITVDPKWRTSGVYVLECCDCYKIGYATDMASRLGAYVTAIPMGFQVHAIIPSDKPRELERALHLRFGGYRVRGEWFRLMPEEAGYLALLAAEPQRAAGLMERWL